MAELTLAQIAAKLRARGWVATVTGLGGNVVGLAVDVPGVPADQCVLFTMDDGQEAGVVGLAECEVAANYVAGTVGLDEDNGSRRFVLTGLDRCSDHVVEFVRWVAEAGKDAE